MTYREEIQSLVEQVESLHRKAERLRDHAVEEEKGYWNGLRQVFGNGIGILNRLDNSLDEARALMQLSDGYKFCNRCKAKNCDNNRSCIKCDTKFSS